jgi:F-type H+-transporting ATPase subunit delta
MKDVAKEYAQALFALGCESGEHRDFMAALSDIAAQLEQYPEYLALLASPALTLGERMDALSRVLGEDYPAHVRSFLQLLCEKRRMRSFPTCVKEYGRLLDAKERMLTAHVRSAFELTEQQKNALRVKLERVSGAHVTLECQVDASLLGGVIVEMDGRVMDGSLRRRLQEIKEVISHEP